MPRKRLEWRDKEGKASYTTLPLWAWLLDEWFQRAHPHWDWWQRMWAKVLPYWGDPLCAAYCFPFSNWIYQHMDWNPPPPSKS